MTVRRRLPAVVREAQAKAKQLRLQDQLIGANKNRSVKATYRGEQYDSRGEAEYAAKLDVLVKARKVAWWDRPGRMAIDDRCLTCGALPDRPCVGKGVQSFHRARMVYKPDFYVVPREGNSYYVDFKGRLLRGWNRIVVQWRKNIPFELRVAYKTGEETVVATGDESIRRLA